MHAFRPGSAPSGPSATSGCDDSGATPGDGSVTPVTHDWPDSTWLQHWWPLPGPIDTAEVGSGLRVVDAAGHAWHLKRRGPGRLSGELFVLARLASVGVPVTVPARTVEGLADTECDGFSYWLYPELPGVAIAQRPAVADDGTRAAWRRLGLAAARLQHRLRAIDTDQAVLQGVPVRRASVAPAPCGVQVIHGDMHAGNVLTGPAGEVSGYLDFDHLSIGPRLIDPCYASGSLLARLLDAGASGEQRWLALTADLLAGWCAGWATAEVPVTVDELRAVADTTIEIEADFRGWFTDIGDEAGAALTDRIVEVVRRRSDELVSLALTDV